MVAAEALWQAQQKCRQLVVVRPRMEMYIRISMQITRIFEAFTDKVEPYSIDEQFLDVTGNVHLFGDPLQLAAQIRQRVWMETYLYFDFLHHDFFTVNINFSIELESIFLINTNGLDIVLKYT